MGQEKLLSVPTCCFCFQTSLRARQLGSHPGPLVFLKERERALAGLSSVKPYSG